MMMECIWMLLVVVPVAMLLYSVVLQIREDFFKR